MLCNDNAGTSFTGNIKLLLRGSIAILKTEIPKQCNTCRNKVMNIDCKDGSFVKCTKFGIVPNVWADYDCWEKDPVPRSSCASGGSGTNISDYL
uniref:Uncharacterized protein n=1 Tax=viral metagenome TaxID=1070528 RepID=A0A6M3MAC2_9ZZZZ